VRLVKHNLELLLLQGGAKQVLTNLIDELSDGESISAASTIKVYWNRCYDPVTRARDTAIKTSLKKRAETLSFNGSLLFEPWETLKSDGTPYRVFTPFYRNLVPQLSAIKTLAAPRHKLKMSKLRSLSGVDLEKFDLLPEQSQGGWDQSMMTHWKVGERAAKQRLNTFLKRSVESYSQLRDVPSLDATSRMSPHLHFGEISPRQILVSLMRHREDVFVPKTGAETLAREVLWREFAYQLLYHFPTMVNTPLDSRFKDFPWARANAKQRRAWQQGRTGVPIVDAGMRQLWQSGWMHNRVRMIAGSYWVKNLLQDWRVGENWFRDTLVDADMASNVMGWQWICGCGADASPFFRVFNPVLQGQKFDPDGEYVRRWIPELQNTPTEYIHRPWELAKRQRPSNYPEPLVDLKQTRQRALMALDKIKNNSASVTAAGTKRAAT